MTPQQMLRNLNERGDDAGSDHNDGLDGYFGWSISDDVLTVRFEADEALSEDEHQWRLVPLDDAS